MVFRKGFSANYLIENELNLIVLQGIIDFVQMCGQIQPYLLTTAPTCACEMFQRKCDNSRILLEQPEQKYTVFICTRCSWQISPMKRSENLPYKLQKLKNIGTN